MSDRGRRGGDRDDEEQEGRPGNPLLWADGIKNIIDHVQVTMPCLMWRRGPGQT